MCIRFINKKPKLQDKEITITENGTQTVTPDTGKDGLSSVEITTNVSGGGSEYNVKINTSLSRTRNTIIKNIKEIASSIDVGNVTDLSNLFSGFIELTTAPQLLNTSSVTNMSTMFEDSTSLLTIPLLNTSSVTDMSQMFRGCSSLTTIPLLDTSSVTSINYMVYECSSLSNETLNNILAMCINATAYTGTKTLAYIGLNSTQATTCQGLSNYQDFIDAGWTTGY